VEIGLKIWLIDCWQLFIFPPKMKKNDQLEIEIEKLAFGGQGLARVDNQVVFVEEGLPGDRAFIQIKKVRRNYSDARIIEILKPSPLRILPACSHFGNCGGCKWQNLEYQKQCHFKREQVLESLAHIGKMNPEIIPPTIPSPLVFGYRNKMEFSFTDNRWLTPEELRNPDIKKDFALGLHVPGSFDRIMHIEKCWLQDEVMNKILSFSQNFFKDSQFPVFNLKTHQGLLRFLVIRKSFSDHNYMVNVVTFTPARELMAHYAKNLVEKFPQIVSVVNTVNPRFAQIAFGEEEYLIFGQSTITEKIGDFEFEISANSFFQTNPLQAENLYHSVQKFAGTGNKVIWDLYAGTGTIALFLAKRTEKVIGFELIESAVQDATRNAERNGIGNCEFLSGEIRESLAARLESPDVIICDPPRSGMHQDVVQAILHKQPEKIIYVSCNPATLARDLRLMTNEYQLKEVQPVDMFPHTYHIESVALLERI
jgi:23S rRNA (uracil1939-C5)-methyltransferase